MQSIQPIEDSKAKRSYTAPSIKYYGSVKEVTQGAPTPPAIGSNGDCPPGLVKIDDNCYDQ